MKKLLKLLPIFVLFCFAGILHAQSYTIPQASAYGAGVNINAIYTSNQTAGNTNIVGTGFCPGPGCTSSACQSSAVADNAGSHGGTGNNTYIMDQNSAAAQIVCTAIGRAFGITATTGNNTTTTTTATANFQVTFAIEVNGLGASPSKESQGVSSGSGLGSVATAGSCTSGDFVIAYVYSNSQPSAGSGWTAIGTPADNQIAEWQKVTGTGIITATWSGAGTVTGASIVCYKPTAASSKVCTLSTMGAGPC